MRSRLFASIPIFAGAAFIFVVYLFLYRCCIQPDDLPYWKSSVLEAFLVTTLIVRTWNGRPYFRRLLQTLIFTLPLSIAMPFWAGIGSFSFALFITSVIDVQNIPKLTDAITFCLTSGICAIAFCFVLRVAGAIRGVTSRTYLICGSLGLLAGIPLVVNYDMLFGLHKFMWISLFALALILGLTDENQTDALIHRAAR